MRTKQQLTPMPIFNILRYGPIDYDLLMRDYHWSVIRCRGWRERNQIVRYLKPTEGIYALKNENRESNDIYVMSKITKDELTSVLIDQFGKEDFSKLGDVQNAELNNRPDIIIQLLLNSLNKRSQFEETNAEGKFFIVIEKVPNKDSGGRYYDKITAMEITTFITPDYIREFGEVGLSFNLVTFNNILRPKEPINIEEWRDTVFTYDEGKGIQTSGKRTDTNVFVRKALFNEKASVDLLNWGRSADEWKLNGCRSVVLYNVIDRLNKRYGKYLGEVSFFTTEGERIEGVAQKVYYDRLVDHIQNKGIHVYNLTDGENDETVKRFAAAIKGCYGIETKFDGPCSNGYNFPVIYNKSYYNNPENENPVIDPHNEPTIGITQFFTIDTVEKIVEDYEKNSKTYQTNLEKYNNGLAKWLSESSKNSEKNYKKSPPATVSIPQVEAGFEQLFIKEDIKKGKVTFYHWKDEDYQGNWSFAKPVTHSEKHQTILDGFICMSIAHDGSIVNTGFYPPSDPFAPAPFSRLDWTITKYAVIDPKGLVNYVVASHVGSPQKELFTITNGKAIKEMIDKNNADVAEYDEKTKNWSEEEKENDKKNKPHRLAGVTTNETKMKYMGGCIGVGYIKLNSQKWIYYVGAQDSPNQLIAHRSVVYTIKSYDDSEIFFMEMFPMMTVPFIKHNQNATIPFPVKYLNEWYEFEKQKKKQESRK